MTIIGSLTLFLMIKSFALSDIENPPSSMIRFLFKWIYIIFMALSIIFNLLYLKINNKSRFILSIIFSITSLLNPLN